jgi:hypothetical protein
MVTAAEHADLRTRLVALIAEYAAASQRSEATAKVDAILGALPQGERADDATRCRSCRRARRTWPPTTISWRTTWPRRKPRSPASKPSSRRRAAAAPEPDTTRQQ